MRKKNQRLDKIFFLNLDMGRFKSKKGSRDFGKKKLKKVIKCTNGSFSYRKRWWNVCSDKQRAKSSEMKSVLIQMEDKRRKEEER